MNHMLVTARKPRHRSKRHRKLTTAQAILVVTEEMCATVGPTKIKLADIATELGIEPPSIYRHYKGLRGVIAAFGEVALRAEIETFAGLEFLPFRDAFKLQAERLFDLYVSRPGIARFLMVDLAVPGGVHIFEDNDNLELVKELFGLENDLLRRGREEGAIRPMTVTSFIAARLGPALTAISFTDMLAPRHKHDIETLKAEYVETVLAMMAPRG